MPLTYLLPRLVRHFLPGSAVRFLLSKRLIIRPGLETTAPDTAISNYMKNLSAQGVSILNRRILVLGYGGRFTVGCALLDAGASQVLLVDPYAPPDDHTNRDLLPRYHQFLQLENAQVVPCNPRLQIYSDDIRILAPGLEKVDLVLSNSVFEHIDDVEGITQSMAILTQPQGIHLHFIDLRDHYFRFPFEMLTFSESIWKKWLNPTSNLNRYRVKDYRAVFNRFFQQVQIDILDSEAEAWEKVHQRIRPEFLSGHADEDSAALIQVFLRNPR
jgi:hypothetical protein